MDIGIISVRYAKALLAFATENKEEEQVYQEMESLAETFLRVSDLHSALLNPVVSDEQKVSLLRQACSEKDNPSDSTKRFLDLVVKKKRADLMQFIANSYVTLYRASKHLVKGCLTISSPISESTRLRLQQLVESRTQGHVDFVVQTDKDIKGGFILEYDTYRLDASLRTQINKIHRALGN